MSGKILNVSQNAVILGAAVVVVTCFTAWWQKRRAQRNKIPCEWRQVGEISELIMYPLKSGRGIELTEGECTELGIKATENAPGEVQHLRDRILLVYNTKDFTFTTSRNHTSLLLVQTTSEGASVVVLEAPGMPPFRLKLPEVSSAPGNKTIAMWFGEKIEAVDCGDEVAEWISEYLKTESATLRLGYHIPERIHRRKVSIPPLDKYKKYYTRMRNEYTGAFSDIASFMLISESSLADLKTKLPPNLQKIPPKQFRPNLVVRGSIPYEEDSWDWIKVGDNVVLRGFKPCTRCTSTTMDPETGIREPNMEPLRTLKTYRLVKEPAAAKELEGEYPIMGLYLGLHVGGVVNVGDPVYVGED